MWFTEEKTPEIKLMPYSNPHYIRTDRFNVDLRHLAYRRNAFTLHTFH